MSGPKILFFRSLTFACLILAHNIISAQGGKTPIAPDPLREADVTFSKRVWRVIDLREKYNYKAIWAGNPVNKILYEAALSGKLKPYRSDSLKSSFTRVEFSALGSDTEFVKNMIDPGADPDDPGAYRIDTVVDPLIPKTRISHLVLMEEWYFDRKLARTIPRIIAIGLLYHVRFAGQDIGIQPLCWLRYHDRFDKETDCRDILVDKNVFNKENIHDQFSFDDWFEQRRFHSYLIRESNQFDISIMDDPEVKKSGLWALIKAEVIKQQMFEKSTSDFEE